jgi:hypothetical protein
MGDNVSIDSEMLLVTNFVNLKIKSAQSFGCTHRDRVCIRVFIGVSTRTCISISVYTMFVKKVNRARVDPFLGIKAKPVNRG